MAKIALAIGLLVVTNLATFGYATWRCRQETAGQQRLLAEAEQKAAQERAEMAKLEHRLGRLQVWGELIELQQDVNAAHAAINRLNFGDALGLVDRIQQRLEGGEYGELFQQNRDRLRVPLEEARRALRAADATAHGHLVDLDQEAFQILAGVTSPTDFPGRPSPAPGTTPGTLSPQPPPPQPVDPLPTASPAASPATSPLPSPTPAPR